MSAAPNVAPARGRRGRARLGLPCTRGRLLREALALGLLGLAACSETTELTGDSVLLVTLDTTNTTALSPYGAPEGLTPNIDRLAAEGVLYENARATAPITAPSHASMLTGLYPVRHSVRMNASMVLPDAALTLAECAQASGVQTAAFVAAVVLREEFGLGQGFELYDEPTQGPSADANAVVSRSCIEMTERALEWFDRRDRSRPFFLWLHYFDPHGPYRPPAAFQEAAGGDAYLGEVAWVDKQLGRVFARLDQEGLFDSTLVVLTADHGEGLGRHDESTHGMMLFDSTLRVPLLLRYPDGWRAGERLDDRVSLVDLYPTLGSALGVPVLDTVDGFDLYRQRAPRDRAVYLETYFGYIAHGWSPLVAWVDESGKSVHGSDASFYVASDRDESEDRSDAHLETLAAHRDGIRELLARPRLEQPGLTSGNDELTAQIEKLGYAGAGTEFFHLPEPLEASDRAHPHGEGRAFSLFLRAESQAQKGNHLRAVEMLTEVVEGDPRNHTALHRLGQSLAQTGSFDRAIEVLERAIALREGVWVAPYLDIAQCHEAAGRRDEAIRSYEQAFAYGAGPDLARQYWARLLREAGREAEAIRVESGP